MRALSTLLITPSSNDAKKLIKCSNSYSTYISRPVGGDPVCLDKINKMKTNIVKTVEIHKFHFTSHEQLYLKISRKL